MILLLNCLDKEKTKYKCFLNLIQFLHHRQWSSKKYFSNKEVQICRVWKCRKYIARLYSNKSSMIRTVNRFLKVLSISYLRTNCYTLSVNKYQIVLCNERTFFAYVFVYYIQNIAYLYIILLDLKKIKTQFFKRSFFSIGRASCFILCRLCNAF